MRIKAIFSDLDRTLLRDGKIISDYTIDVLNRCRAAGIKVALATARSRNSALAVIAPIEWDGIICNSGALVQCGGETIASHTMGREESLSFIRTVLQAAPQALAAVDTGGDTYGNFTPPQGWPTYRQVEDFSALPFSSAEKLTFSVDNQSPEAIKTLLKNHLQPALSQDMRIEYDRFGVAAIQHAQATKLDGVRALCDCWGIPLLYAAAFGDDLSDISMLGGVGWGVAVENAVPEAKAAADIVCGGNNDDGVARWLETNVLSSQG